MVDKAPHGPEQTSINNSGAVLFPNGGLGYQVTAQPQQSVHQQVQFNRPQNAVSRTYSLQDSNDRSGAFLSNSLADPQLQASLFGQGALSTSGRPGSSSQLDVMPLNQTVPSTSSATPPLHLPLHLSKSASRAVPPRQGLKQI